MKKIMTPEEDEQFADFLRSKAREATQDLGYTPNDLLGMLNSQGGFQSASQLLSGKNISQGFTRLYVEGRLDLSIEALVLESKWRDYFESILLETAAKRLKQARYTVRPYIAASTEPAVARHSTGLKELDQVFQGYAEAKSTLKTVPPNNQNLAVAAIRKGLPDILMRSLIGRKPPIEYKVVGSVGESPLNMAVIPWVAMFRKQVTTSARRGYYIVLLFAEDLSSVVLSLNQGFHDFQKAYGSDQLALAKARACANFVSKIVAVPSGFETGPIDLGASGPLGRGYEQCAILSKRYEAVESIKESELLVDVAALLNAYECLFQLAGDSILTLMPPPSNAEFQDQVQGALAVSTEVSDLTSGKVPRPEKVLRQGQQGYARDPKVAADAIARANYRCEADTQDAQHTYFISKRSRKNYVEAHHLVPVSRQDVFEYSLDVRENIVALCPHCHRLVHHGTPPERDMLLRRLHDARHLRLKGCGIEVSFPHLRTYYSTLAEDD